MYRPEVIGKLISGQQRNRAFLFGKVVFFLKKALSFIQILCPLANFSFSHNFTGKVKAAKQWIKLRDTLKATFQT